MIASLRESFRVTVVLAALMVGLGSFTTAAAQPEIVVQEEQAERAPGGEAALVLPDLGQVAVGGYDGRSFSRRSRTFPSTARCGKSRS